MRRKLLIGLAMYLACGFAFGLLTHRGSYMCPGQAEMRELEPAVIAPEDIDLVDDARMCDTDAVTARLPWVAIATPGWLPLLIRNVMQGAPVQLGGIYIGDAI